MNDETLRQAYAELVRGTIRAGREGCPPVDALAAVVDRQGDEESRLAVLDHVMSCLPCRKDFEILRAIEVSTPAPARRSVPLALAASVLLVLAGALIWRNVATPDEPTRSGTLSVRLVAPEGTIRPGEELRLVWQTVSPASAYTAEILREDATVAWSVRTRDTAVTVPDSVQLEMGQDYRWWVRAAGEDGSEARSELRRFQLNNQ